MKNDLEKIYALLKLDLKQPWLHFYRFYLKETAESFLQSIQYQNIIDKNEGTLKTSLAKYISTAITQKLNHIDDIKQCYKEFATQYKNENDIARQQEIILWFAKQMGASKNDLKQDKKAFKRWFDYEAIVCRYLEYSSCHEQKTLFLLSRLKSLLINFCENKIKFEHDSIGCLILCINYSENHHIIISALDTLTSILRCMKSTQYTEMINDQLRQKIHNLAADEKLDIWIVSASIELLQLINANSFEQLFEQQYNSVRNKKSLIFLRHRLIKLLPNSYHNEKFLNKWVDIAIKDEFPYVRLALATIIDCLPDKYVTQCLPSLIIKDDDPAIRAKMLLKTAGMLDTKITIKEFVKLLIEKLEHEQDDHVLRLTMLVIVRCIYNANHEEKLKPLFDYTHLLFEKIKLVPKRFNDKPYLHHWVANYLENLWCDMNPARHKLRVELEKWYRTLPKGKPVNLPKNICDQQDKDTIGRVLALLTSANWNLDIQQKKNNYVAKKGFIYKHKFWRIWYEFTHPQVDKRYGFAHTIARVFKGNIRIPSAILAESSQTSVISEPLWLFEEKGWRPFLPTIDDVLPPIISKRYKDNVTLYTNEGKTIFKYPKKLWGRLKCYFKISLNAEKLSSLRNWEKGQANNENAYTEKLKKYGIEMEFTPYEYTDPDDKEITRFFTPAFIPIPIMKLFYDLKYYILSVYANTFAELVLFLTIFLIAFFCYNIFRCRKINRARYHLPLVIGGWGTRGKSSIERLKAALFHGMGFKVLGKTTGSAATLAISKPRDELKELLIYRSYDKTSIAEQANVLMFSENFTPDVFLWECMGLQPEFIDILQSQWMHDDISSIINAHPDHTDIQGPAGFNVAYAIARFIPNDAKLVTAEEHMLPIMRDIARARNTSMSVVNWIDLSMITKDIKACFTTSEHPSNVALVMKIAQYLNFDSNKSLYSLINFLLPDIGAFKKFIPARIFDRKIQFFNGMSANDKISTLSNWYREGFDHSNLTENPNNWIIVLANNRADRISRSITFADIMVNDLGADRYALVGTNLIALYNFIKKSWKDFFTKAPLYKQIIEGQVDETSLEAYAKKIRVYTNPEQFWSRFEHVFNYYGINNINDDFTNLITILKNKLSAMQTPFQDSIIKLLQEEYKTMHSYLSIKSNLSTAEKPLKKAKKNELLSIMQQWFMRKIIIIKDHDADSIYTSIAQETLPGLDTLILGIQNIKDAGINIITSWNRWEKINSILTTINIDKQDSIADGLYQLLQINNYGLLSTQTVKDFLVNIKEKHGEVFAKQIIAIQNKLNANNTIQQTEKHPIITRIYNWGLKIVNDFLDPSLSIKRKKIADLIYQDLANKRICYQKAADELELLVLKQRKGKFKNKPTREST